MPALDIWHRLLLQAISVSAMPVEAAHRLGITPSALNHRLQEAGRR